MAGMVPQSVSQVEKGIESMMQEIQVKHLVPKQKEAFLCCAKCCDTDASDVRNLQNCVERCSANPAQSQKVIHSVMNDFQERFSRCAARCQDLARDIRVTNDFEQEKAQSKFLDCMEGCGKEALGRLPNMKSDIISQLKRL